MVSQMFTFIISLCLLLLFTRGEWVVKKGKNSVYVVIEWPHRVDGYVRKNWVSVKYIKASGFRESRIWLDGW